MEVGFVLAKYSFEFKKKVVQEYLGHEGSYASLAKKFGIASGKDIRKWVNAYKAFGDDGLKRSRENKKYTFDFKMSVVELYLTSEISYQELALSVGITNPEIRRDLKHGQNVTILNRRPSHLIICLKITY